MAESEAQKSSKPKENENKAEPGQEGRQTPSRCKRVLNALSAKNFGILLKYSIITFWALHCNLFAFCGCVCLSIACCITEDAEDGPAFMFAFMFMTLGPVVTTSVVVFLINSVGDYYDDIQSWQIAYITWGAFCTFIFEGFLTLASYYGDPNEDEEGATAVLRKVVKWLLYPFGIKPRQAEDETMFWTVPLVSFAPAMVIGYFANFILEPNYVFECDESYGPIADPDSCFNDGAICCMAISSHSEPMVFMASLASTVLAAWGVVKIIGYVICLHDDDIVVDEDDTEKTKKLVKDALSSTSVRDIMKDSIALSEKEETETPKVKETEAGANQPNGL